MKYTEQDIEELIQTLKDLVAATDKDYCVYCGNYKNEGHANYCIFAKVEKIIEKVN